MKQKERALFFQFDYSLFNYYLIAKRKNGLLRYMVIKDRKIRRK